MRDVQELAALWKGWTQRDDRTWLLSLLNKPLRHADNQKELRPLLEQIVNMLHFPEYHLRGLAPSKEETSEVIQEFLTWLEATKTWKQLHKQWAHDNRGPWSLPLYLGKAFLHYRSALKEESQTESSYLAARKSIRSFPKGAASALSEIFSQDIVGAFEHTASELSEDLQLPYKLYLEGLCIEEIGLLSGFDTDHVEACIHEAKAELCSEIKRSLVK